MTSSLVSLVFKMFAQYLDASLYGLERYSCGTQIIKLRYGSNNSVPLLLRACSNTIGATIRKSAGVLTGLQYKPYLKQILQSVTFQPYHPCSQPQRIPSLT